MNLPMSEFSPSLLAQLQTVVAEYRLLEINLDLIALKVFVTPILNDIKLTFDGVISKNITGKIKLIFEDGDFQARYLQQGFLPYANQLNFELRFDATTKSYSVVVLNNWQPIPLGGPCGN